MASEDVQSFVGKFLALWAIGKNVSLSMNSNNGKATINMQLDLGDYKPCGSDNAFLQTHVKRQVPRVFVDKIADHEIVT